LQHTPVIKASDNTADVDGNGGNNMQIEVKGLISPTVSDFDL